MMGMSQRVMMTRHQRRPLWWVLACLFCSLQTLLGARLGATGAGAALLLCILEFLQQPVDGPAIVHICG